MSDALPIRVMRASSFLVVVLLLQFWVLATPWLKSKALLHDNLFHYSMFHDEWESLNKFGVHVWNLDGYPTGRATYLIGVLNSPSLFAPMGRCFGGGALRVGRLGFHPAGWMPFYVFYFAIVAPWLFVVACWLAARQVFGAAAQCYVIAVAAFSPAVLLNLTDVGHLEHLAWFVLWMTAVTAFVNCSGRWQRFSLWFCTVALALTANHLFLMFEVWALPLFLLLLLLWPRAVKTVRREWLTLAGVVTVAALVWLITYLPALSQVRGYSRSGNDGLTYGASMIHPGNILEVLLQDPRVGFDWVGNSFAAMRGGFSYGYIGVFALPLLVIGLGNFDSRLYAALLVATVCMVMVLTLHPVWEKIASLYPLSTNRHWADCTWRAGGFLLVLFLSAFGLSKLPSQIQWLILVLTLGDVVGSSAHKVGEWKRHHQYLVVNDTNARNEIGLRQPEPNFTARTLLVTP